jgi:hypothetical protein
MERMSNWQISESGTSVPLTAGEGELSFTVTNGGSAPDRVVLTVTPLDGAAEEWFTVDRPQRQVEPGASAVFEVAVAVPLGTATGTYALQGVAYSADSDPSESSVTSKRVTLDVAPSVAPKRPMRWPYIVAAVIALLVILVIVFLVTRDDGNTTTTTPPAPVPGIVTLTGAGPGGGSGEVALAWNAVADAVGYRVLRAPSESEPFEEVADVDVTNGAVSTAAGVTNISSAQHTYVPLGAPLARPDTSPAFDYVDAGLGPGCFRVAAYNASGEGPPSAVSCGSPPSGT